VDPAVVRWGARHRGRRRRREQCPLQCGVIQPVGQRPAPRPAWPGVGSGAPWTARFAPTRRSADRSARPHGPAASPLRSLVCCRREDKTDARDDAGIIVDQTRTRRNLHHAYGRSARRVTRAVPPANQHMSGPMSGPAEVACNKGARATCDWPSTRNAITCYGI
jgi:hypothetical protein